MSSLVELFKLNGTQQLWQDLSCFLSFFVISRITLRVRKLLLLIPTDPEVQDALDNFVPKESSVWSHQVRQTICDVLWSSGRCHA